MTPSESQTISDSTNSVSTGVSRRTFIAAMTGLSVVAGCDKQYVPMELPEEIIGEVVDAIEEYRMALKACLDTPTQDTAETLNRASGLANTKYFCVQPDLKASQRLDIGVEVGDLNERAAEAVAAVKPQTRYTQHYLNTIKDREAIWTLQAVGDHAGVRQLLEKQLKKAEKNVTHTMSYEESVKYMSQPVDSKE